jgi:condensin complex subunit 2
VSFPTLAISLRIVTLAELACQSHRSEAALQIKKFDLEATVDPLFKKTSADFDEGGAMGLLMNHLGVDGQGRVVFDAGDAGLDQDNEDIEVEDELIDLTRLRRE